MLAFSKLKLLIICTLFITLTYGGPAPDTNKTATTAGIVQHNSSHSKTNDTKVVATESGNIIVPVLNITANNQTTNPRETDHTSREHVSNQKSNFETLLEQTKGSKKTSLPESNSRNTTKTVLEDLVTENTSLADKRHLVHKSIVARKEATYNVTEPPPSSIPPPIVRFNISNADVKNSSNSNNTSASKSISITNTTSTTTTTTPSPTTTKPKKPTVTIGSEDDPLDNLSSKDKNQSTLKPNDKIMDPTRRTNTNYIVPIVAVILSVPLVAILASVLYKRGSEWWQHRHYRRMDFLIDGIYNN